MTHVDIAATIAPEDKLSKNFTQRYKSKREINRYH